MDIINKKGIAKLSISFIAAFLFSFNTQAQDVLGSEMSYQCVGPNTFSITHYYYYNCNRGGMPATIDIDWSGCSNSGVQTLTQISVVDVTEMCPTQQSSCNGGTGSFGVERVEYRGTIVLPAGCTNMIFSNNYSHREGVSNNVASGSQLLYVENTLDNTITPCNSSPQFLKQPTFYTLTAGANSFTNEAFDPDGDSLVYSIEPALKAFNTPVNYNVGYSATFPFGLAIPYSINSTNGTITHTGAAPTGKTVLAIRVDEYRNGVKIGSVVRDWTMQHFNLSNANKPIISGFNGGSLYADTICPETYCVPITIADADAGDNIYFVIINDTGSYFFFNTTGTNPMTVNVCWNTSKSMLPGTYYFSLEAQDDACPLSLKADEQFFSVTIKPNGQSTDTQVACDSLTWTNGITYYASNATAKDTIPNGSANGCDSIVSLNLTINGKAQGTDTQVACDAYTWINGITYLMDNNTAKDTILNGAASGCDSVVTLNLTINTVDVTVTANNDTITSNATGAIYQWLDCDNNYAIISGASSQQFIASSNGNYAVQVTQNGCTDTSDCSNVVIIGLEDYASSINYKVYPNPTNGIITIALNDGGKDLSFEIMSIDGKVIASGLLNNTINPIDISSEANGIYFLKVTGQESSFVHKVIKH